MKKILLLGILLVSLLSACQDDDTEPAPGERPEERLNKVLTDYKAQLINAENGWKAVLYPKGGEENSIGGYSFSFKFAQNDRVTMSSDIEVATTVTPLESTYRLNAAQQPSLLFDTYSYLHILADPDPDKSKGEVGAGKYSDFEFSFDSVSTDRITLTGNSMGSKLILTRATPDDAANFINRVATTATTFEKINALTTYFKRLNIGSISYDVSVNVNQRLITLSYLEGGTLKTFTTPYYYTENGVVFINPFIHNNQNITALTSVQFEEATKKLTVTVNNTVATILESDRPAQVDLQVARRFLNNPANGGSYWISESGFTVNGVTDAFNIASIPNYTFLVYFPEFNTFENTLYDLLGFVAFTSGQNSLEYGPAAVPRITNNGRIIYDYLGMLGADNIPAEYQSIITATQEQWTEPSGFYVIQTGANTYDLVSAKDARAWISFE